MYIRLYAALERELLDKHSQNLLRTRSFEYVFKINLLATVQKNRNKHIK